VTQPSAVITWRRVIIVNDTVPKCPSVSNPAAVRDWLPLVGWVQLVGCRAVELEEEEVRILFPIDH